MQVKVEDGFLEPSLNYPLRNSKEIVEFENSLAPNVTDLETEHPIDEMMGEEHSERSRVSERSELPERSDMMGEQHSERSEVSERSELPERPELLEIPEISKDPESSLQLSGKRCLERPLRSCKKILGSFQGVFYHWIIIDGP